MSDKVEKAILVLQKRKTNLCCEDVKNLLQSLGFIIRDGKNGGHKIFVHPRLTDFRSGSLCVVTVRIQKSSRVISAEL